MNRFSFAERTTRWPSSEESELEPACRYFEGPASESESDDDDDDDDDEPEPPELLLLEDESESLPEESSPPQNFEACLTDGGRKRGQRGVAGLAPRRSRRQMSRRDEKTSLGARRENADRLTPTRRTRRVRDAGDA